MCPQKAQGHRLYGRCRCRCVSVGNGKTESPGATTGSHTNLRNACVDRSENPPSSFIRTFQGPLGQTHTHKPRKGVRVRRSQTLSPPSASESRESGTHTPQVVHEGTGASRSSSAAQAPAAWQAAPGSRVKVRSSSAVCDLIDHEQCKAASPCSVLPQPLGERGRTNWQGSLIGRTNWPGS